MFYRFLALLLAVLCFLSVTACSDPQSFPETDTDGTVSSSVSESETDSSGSDTDISTDDSASTTTVDTSSDSSETVTDASSLGTDGDSSTTDDSTSSETKTKEELAQEILESGSYLVALTDQGNSRVVVCDLSVEDWTDDNAVVWKTRTMGGVAGVKFRDNPYWGQSVMICCAATRAIIVSYDSKKVLLETTEAPKSSHAVELLPNGVFVVAGSNGNEIRVFGAGQTTPSHVEEFAEAHSVLWDPAYNVLWAGGGTVVQAYRVVGTAENPKLEKAEGMTYSPNRAIHDISPVYGNTDLLLITGRGGVVLFDKKTGKTSFDYSAGSYLSTQGYVPGVGIFESGVCVFTTIRRDTTVYNDWCTDQVCVYVPVGDSGCLLIRRGTGDAYYKARLFSFDYQ